jgi:molybdopterin molybdotransferase
VISVDDYAASILTTVGTVSVETVELAQAFGRVLREEVRAKVTLPPWPNSAMDGYAVHALDLRNASADNPATLPVVADIEAGSSTRYSLEAGTAARIMTGAPIPQGCTSVVPVEKIAGWNPSVHTVNVTAPAEVTFVASVNEGANIRLAGEDALAGDLVLAAGQSLTAPRVAACAAAGMSTVSVSSRLRVAIITTGTELVEPGLDLEWGQIYDSNGPLVQGLVEASGAQLVSITRVADNPGELFAAVKEASVNSDVLILTGGASVGAYDTTRLVLDQSYSSDDDPIGDEFRRVSFQSVAMQPGKPQGFGVLDSGTRVWALPGNPVSVWVSFQMFIEPALAAMQGSTVTIGRWIPVTASASWSSPMGREQFMPVIFTSDSGETLSVAPASARGSGSHLAASLGRMTAMARVAQDVSEVNEGDTVLVKGSI